MDSEKILSIFFFIVSFLLLCPGLQARKLDSGSPSPSPAQTPALAQTPAQTPASAPAPAPGPSNDGCWLLLSKSCRNGSLTACIDTFSTASKDVMLFVKNDGEEPLEVNISISHAKQIINKGMSLSRHQIKKVNIAANLGGGNSSILLDAGNLKCVINMVSSASIGGSIFDNIPFTTHITPMNGAYLLILTGLIVGSAWACCKRKGGGGKGRQGNGIPYQELEMGQQPDSPSANHVETAEGWEQDWDGDWDQLKSKAAHRSANGLNSRPAKRDGQQNTWDD